MSVKGLILSGGMSSRMGMRPKALCRYSEQYNFLEKIVHTMQSSGLADITVITGFHQTAIDSYTKENPLTSVKYLFNHDWKSGMLSSIHRFLKTILDQPVKGFLMVPVDHPFVLESTYAEILRNAQENRIVIPRFNGRKGHPVFWGSAFFEALMNADPQIGARDVSRSNKDKIMFINTLDSGILKDIDTMEEYMENFR